jgi:hypothetical protein
VAEECSVCCLFQPKCWPAELQQWPVGWDDVVGFFYNAQTTASSFYVSSMHLNLICLSVSNGQCKLGRQDDSVGVLLAVSILAIRSVRDSKTGGGP